jgi:hypothetical protein
MLDHLPCKLLIRASICTTRAGVMATAGSIWLYALPSLRGNAPVKNRDDDRSSHEEEDAASDKPLLNR